MSHRRIALQYLMPTAATPEEAAAITAAILAYLDTESTPAGPPTPTTNAWRLAGRLEAHHLPVTPTTLTDRWRS